MSAARVLHVGEQTAAGGESQTDERPEGGAEEADDRGSRCASLMGSGPRRRPTRPRRCQIDATREPTGEPSIATARRRPCDLSAEGSPSASRRVPTATISRPCDLGRLAAPAGRRHDRPAEAEPGGFPQPAFEPIHRAQLTEQPDLADGDRPGCDGPVAEEPRRGRSRPAGRGRARRRPGRRPGSRTRRALPGRSRPGGRGPRRGARAGSCRCRWPSGGACRTTSRPTRAWTSTRSGRVPSRVGATTLPDAGHGWSAEERPRRIVELRQADLAHLEDADLLGRPEPVLGRAQQAKGGEPLALEAIRTASTRCSSVFGPASVPSFVTWPTRTTAIASRLRPPCLWPAP